MFNNSFKIGDSNTNLGENSTILGGNSNYISFGAVNISLQGCIGVVVQGDVVNFVGINIPSYRVIDSSLSNTTLIYGNIKRPIVQIKTADFVVDGQADIYEIDLDAIGVDIKCTWNPVTLPIQLTFKIIANSSGLNFIIDENGSPSATIDGNATPFTTGLILNESLTIYSNGTNLKII